MIDPTSSLTHQPQPDYDAGDYVGLDGPPPLGDPVDTTEEVSLRSLLRTQLLLTKAVQDQLVNGGINSLPPREVKELISSVSSILNIAHRTEEIVNELDTYKLFKDVVMEFLKTRQDETGEKLIEELRKVADRMRDKEGHPAGYVV